MVNAKSLLLLNLIKKHRLWIIDIDIVFYGKRIIRDKGLEIPHPEIVNRAFVLVPMMEIDPEFEHPVLKQPIDHLYMNCEDQSDVVRLDAWFADT